MPGDAVDVLRHVLGTFVAFVAEGAAGKVDAVRGCTDVAVRGVLAIGFHDVLLVFVGQAGYDVARREVHSACAGGELTARHRVGCDVFVLRSGVFERRSGIPVLGSDVPVWSRAV